MAEPTPEQLERYNRMMVLEGNDIALEVTNTYGANLNAGGRTVSREALDYLLREIETWVGTRLLKRMQADLPASKVTVHLSVEFPRE